MVTAMNMIVPILRTVILVTLFMQPLCIVCHNSEKYENEKDGPYNDENENNRNDLHESY